MELGDRIANAGAGKGGSRRSCPLDPGYLRTGLVGENKYLLFHEFGLERTSKTKVAPQNEMHVP